MGIDDQLIDGDGVEWKFETSDIEEESHGATTNEEQEAAVEFDGDIPPIELWIPALPTVEQATPTSTNSSSLVVCIIREAKIVYNHCDKLGLISLISIREFIDSLQKWTNKMLKFEGKPKITPYELNAIAMSFNPVTESRSCGLKSGLWGNKTSYASTQWWGEDLIGVLSVGQRLREQDPNITS